MACDELAADPARDDGVVTRPVGDLRHRRAVEKHEIGSHMHGQTPEALVKAQDPRRVRRGRGERLER